MKLTKVEIAGYRSISKKIVVHFDDAVTIILGANDHGKTNLLDALTHLNTDTTFDPERDLNWDHIDKSEEFPSLTFAGLCTTFSEFRKRGNVAAGICRFMTDCGRRLLRLKLVFGASIFFGVTQRTAGADAEFSSHFGWDGNLTLSRNF